MTLSAYDEEETSTPCRRVTRDVGIRGKNFKDTGVNKMFIIAASPMVKETYSNSEIFIKATNINNTV